MKNTILFLLALAFSVTIAAQAQQETPLLVRKFSASLSTSQQQMGWSTTGTVANSAVDTLETFTIGIVGAGNPADTLLAYYFATDADSGKFTVEGYFGANGVFLPIAFADSGHWRGSGGAVISYNAADSTVVGHALYFRKPAKCNQIRLVVRFAAAGNATDNGDAGILNAYTYKAAILTARKY